MIDRHGGHIVMPVGALLGAAGLIGIVYASDPILYLAMWVVLGAAMAASLYDPAFATLARIFGLEARRAITLLTFIGGFASTVSWPATHLSDRGDRLARHLRFLRRFARLRRSPSPCLHAAARARSGESPAGRAVTEAAQAYRRERLAVPARGGGFRALFVHPLGAVGAHARDLYPLWDRRRRLWC